MALGELRLALERRKYLAAQPVAQDSPSYSLQRPNTTTDLRILHYQVALSGWDGPQFRIVHLSDLHVNQRLPVEYYIGVVERAQRAEPDLIFITGDFVSEIECAPLLPGILSGLVGKLGTYATLGNHDYWANPATSIAAIVRKQGIHLLHNGWQQLSLGQEQITILGCERPWNRQRCPAPIIQPGELALGLSHTADNIYSLSRSGLTAVFSGHYHGGQLQIPGFGPLVVPSRYRPALPPGPFQRKWHAPVRQRRDRRGQAAPTSVLPTGFYDRRFYPWKFDRCPG